MGEWSGNFSLHILQNKGKKCKLESHKMQLTRTYNTSLQNYIAFNLNDCIFVLAQ